MIFKSVVLAVTTLGLSSVANAALIERLGGLAYYDDVANLTWLADANYAMTSGYDNDGLMNWYDSMAWAASLDINGVTGWRLPDSDSCTGLNCTGSEMGNLHYNVLLNPAGSFTNPGPFINLPTDDGHWSATDAPDPTNAYDFFFLDGTQNDHNGSTNTKEIGQLYAWAVRSGDVSATPVLARDDLIIDFGGIGLWARMNDATWLKLNMPRLLK